MVNIILRLYCNMYTSNKQTEQYQWSLNFKKKHRPPQMILWGQCNIFWLLKRVITSKHNKAKQMMVTTGASFYTGIVLNMCRFFVSFVCIYCHCRSSYQEGRVEIPITGLTPTIFVCLSQTRKCIFNVICHGFLCSVSSLIWELIVRFADIGGINYHGCLNFLFVMHNT